MKIVTVVDIGPTQFFLHHPNKIQFLMAHSSCYTQLKLQIYL